MSDVTPAAPGGHAAHESARSGSLVPGRIGFGGYRIDDQTPEHRQALELALASGCRLIDTSTNYTDGGSERLIGAVLHELTGRGAIRREEIAVVTKIGYVQGANLEVALERERAGRPFPEMVRYMEGCWHCIHPDFLRDQLTRSQERLRLETVDVCLLHNPEYFLSDAAKHRRGGLEEARSEFDRRLREAFAFLEESVKAGRLRGYGVSSNTAVSAPGDPEATSVVRMLAAAEAAGGSRHHFRILQVPMNLFESGAALTRNTGPGNGQTALQAAAAAGLEVLLNRPLNAFVEGRLLRLAEPRVLPPEMPIAESVSILERLEKEYRSEVGAPEADHKDADLLFEMVGQVAGLADQIEDFLHWQQVEQQYIIPRMNTLVGALGRGVPAGRRDRFGAWWDRYLPALRRLLQDVGRTAASKGREQAVSIASAIDPALPRDLRGESLSRKALHVLTSTPGVGAVLVGMRRAEYVRDALGIAGWPPLADPIAILRHFADPG